jgi:hypothetical protein
MTLLLFLLCAFVLGCVGLVTVTTPNPHFSGQRNGVQFEDGQGEATPEQAENLVTVWGYSCDALEQEAAAEGSDSLQEIEIPPKDSTNDELRSFMQSQGIDFESDDNKADLNAKIEDWVEEQDTPKSPKGDLSSPQQDTPAEKDS